MNTSQPHGPLDAPLPRPRSHRAPAQDAAPSTGFVMPGTEAPAGVRTGWAAPQQQPRTSQPTAPQSAPRSTTPQPSSGGPDPRATNVGPTAPTGPAGPMGPGFPNGPQPPMPPRMPSTPPPRREPRFTREQIVAGLLAGAGVAVTLIGIVLLLVMAAREGYLTPGVRVAGGAVVAAGLAGAAFWVRPRLGGRIGAVALLATAAAAAFFDVMAVTRIYAWVPTPVGLVLALALAATAGLVAMRWDEKWLFVVVTLGVALLGPALTHGVTLALIGFLAVIQVAGVAPEVLKGWDEISLARTVPVALAATGFVIAHATDEQTTWQLVSAVVVALVGAGSALLVATTRRSTTLAPMALLASWMPIWVAAVTSERLTWSLVAAAMTIVAAGLLVAMRTADALMRVAVVALVAVSAVTFAFGSATGNWMAVPFVVLAMVLFSVAPRLGETEGTVTAPVVRMLALGALAVGVVTQGFVSSYGDLFYRSRAADLPHSVAVVGLLLVAVGAAAVYSVRSRVQDAGQEQVFLVVAGASALLGASMALVALLGATAFGFFTVHLVITVMALAVAAVVMTAGLQRPRHLGASMVWGLVLVGCALGKLFLFDLQYMGSMTKALTFVIAGLVLLAAGTKYARTYAEASKARTAMNAQAGRDGEGQDGHPMGV